MILLVVEHIMRVHAYSLIDVGIVVKGIIGNVDDSWWDNPTNTTEY